MNTQLIASNEITSRNNTLSKLIYWMGGFIYKGEGNSMEISIRLIMLDMVIT
ncbi:hypothetical protein R5N98_00510 [Tenacibaculum maritimum]|uniref:hypothetical protein n=1 Tax=Tenacibaculum maritimum TaxID=107401 RepID=UPI0012FFD3A4|nr:hypothetical protein [Tenacibaculum maritimum]MCD9583523.1 hypothetical protein [Tenacibaculum maritimum]MCD9610220.1 hypothetical protein [Tenacibaculum maritimum]MCD9620350.1 hypothetical protein [Tenacibaculum maritimum]MCD9627965.1 hypothetical protein [Tenacibaculum maritimum]MCD9629955.1 hypothetical protein [Tenacibaculum maritimum]